VAEDAPDGTGSGRAWVAGPAPDLLLGAGGAYLLSVPLLWLVASRASAADWPLWVAWVIAILINGPHYGATLLRVYERREERQRYALFSVWVTLLLWLAFVVALHRPLVGFGLVTVYFTWSPWHFAGQNYGVSLMFLRRAGVPVSPTARRCLHASFFLSFALTFLALHVEGSTGIQAPTRDVGYTDLELLRLGIPQPVAVALMLVCGALYLASLTWAASLLRRKATARQLLPVGALAACQALWFAVPSALDLTNAWSARSLAFAAIWISAAHSLQYLWVTLHHAKQTAAGTRLPGYLARTALVGNAAIAIPGIFFAPGLLGASLTWDAGLSTLVFSVVNLHHFVLDGAVWRLRDGRVARALLRGGVGRAVAANGITPPRRSWGARALWATCAFCLALEVGELVRQQAQHHGAYGAAAAMLDGLSRLGRDHELARIRLGRSLLERGDVAAAQVQFERSADARPTVAAFGGLGRSLQAQGDLLGAAEAYEAGLALDPEDAALLRSAGLARLELGQPVRAAELLERALRSEPQHLGTRRTLERARSQIGP
jgi:hypothetical protein